LSGPPQLGGTDGGDCHNPCAVGAVDMLEIVGAIWSGYAGWAEPRPLDGGTSRTAADTDAFHPLTGNSEPITMLRWSAE